MAGAGCITDKDFGDRGINVADRDGRCHVKIAGAGVYDGGVVNSIGGFGWRRGGTSARRSRSNKFTICNFIFTCYSGSPAASLHEVSSSLVAVRSRACRILAGYGVKVDRFLGAADGAGMVGVDSPAMDGAEATNDPFVFEQRANL